MLIRKLLHPAIIPVILFRILLDIAYPLFIYREYAYMGFDFAFSPLRLFESYAVLGLSLLYLPRDSNKISSIIFQFLFIFTFIPIQSYFAFGGNSRTWFYLVTFFWMLSIALIRTPVKFKITFPKKNFFPHLIIFSTIIAAISAALIYLFMKVGFSFGFDYETIYSIREEYAETNIPFSGYLINWSAKVMIPFIALTALFGNRKKFTLFPVAIAIMLTLFLFMNTGHKGYFFIILLALGFAAMLILIKNFLKTFGYMLNGLIAGSLLLFLLSGHLLAPSLFIRRIFFMPAQISFHYYDFFKGNYLYLSNSIFRYFTSYPYSLSPSKLIGAKYMYEPGSSNNGIIADAFKNFGIPGLVIWSVIFVLLLKFGDALSENKNKLVIWPMLLSSFYFFVNSPLFTTLLTHGMLLVLLYCYLYPTKDLEKL